MKLSNERIIEIWNCAIENETGIKGNLIPEIATWGFYEVKYYSKTNKTVITLFNTDIYMDDLTDKTIKFVSEGDEDDNFFFCF